MRIGGVQILFFTCLFTFGYVALNGYAQATEPVQVLGEVLHKPYHERAEAIRTIYDRVLSQPDSSAAAHITNLATVAERAGDREILLEMQLLQAIHDARQSNIPLEKAVQAMQEVADKAGREQIWAVQVRALKRIARTWWNHQRYERMFEAFMPLEQRIKEIPPNPSPPEATRIKLTGDAYSNIAEAYFFFENYSKAISYLKEAVALPHTKFNTREMVRAWNNMGLCYQETGELEESNRYFKKIINYHPQDDIHPLWNAIAGGNLGSNYYRQGRFDEAIPLLKKDISVSAETGVYGEAAIATINLIKIRLEQNRLQDTGEQLSRAREYLTMANNDDKLHYQHELYTVMSKWHAAMGHKKKAALYIDSTQTTLEAHNDNFNSLKLMRARQKNNLQRRKMLMAEKQQQLQQRNLVIAIVLLLFLGSLAAYLFRNRYLLRKQEVKELELENTSKELEHARTRLNNFARRVKENNELIARLKKNGSNDSEQTQILREIKNSTLLTDENWIEFKQLFEQVHPGYIGRLKGVHPNLTPAQVRFMVLVKLQFSRKEMANILGISPQSLRVTWYRIRKKLDLSKDTRAAELAGKV